MIDRFRILQLDIPAGAPGISDLFAGISLCNNGSIVVAYKQPIVIAGVNVGDETPYPFPIPYKVDPGFRIVLDMRRDRL